MATHKKPSDFEKLKATWYKKLKKSGFEDVEANENDLKVNSSKFTRTRTLHIDWDARHTYYRLATHFLNDYKFKNRIEQIIWEYHSNGISMRNIVSLLKQTRVKRKVNKDQVNTIITRLECAMKALYLNE